VQARPDLEGLSNFLSLKYVPAPQTMFAGILALPPGHLLTCGPNGVTVRSYWDLSFSRDQNSDDDEEACVERLEGLLRESVRLRLMSDVPFGAFLSGGIDSSTIVALMSQFLEEPVKTFSVGFEGEGEEFSELPYARLVAQQYQTDHHEILIRCQDYIDLAEKVAWHLDQPIADETIVALMSQFLQEPVKTFSVGFESGGEELGELPYARLVAQQYQTDHHEVLIRCQDYIDLAEKVAWHLDQPIADEAALANYMVAELASRHVKMVLTGEGGDELFAGYARYAGERLWPLFRHIPNPAKSLVLAVSARLPGLRRPKIALYGTVCRLCALRW